MGQCNADSACHAWTWIDGSQECWLKSWVPDERQWASQGGVTSGLKSSAPPPGCSGSVGKNSHGTNLKQADWSNVAEDCCTQCNADSACHAWTWIDGSHECWLKSWVPDESQWASESGVTSGLKGSAPQFFEAGLTGGPDRGWEIIYRICRSGSGAERQKPGDRCSAPRARGARTVMCMGSSLFAWSIKK